MILDGLLIFFVQSIKTFWIFTVLSDLIKNLLLYFPLKKYIGAGAGPKIFTFLKEGANLEISVANLIGTMKELLQGVLKREGGIRLRPGYFPFVEPGFELDMKCLVCEGQGCGACKHSGWVETLPCGLSHPSVIEAGGLDPKEWKGIAFSFGIDRLVMSKYGIEDLRHIHSGDLRFLKQF